MSLPSMGKITCPKCKESQEFRVWNSVNSTNDPQLKQELLSGKLFEFVCQMCGEKTRVEYPLMYHDMDKKIIIYTIYEQDPNGFLEDQLKQDAFLLWIKAGYKIRLVKNSNELIEKIRIFDSGLKDTSVEVQKGAQLFQLRKQGQNVDAIFCVGTGEQKGEKTVEFVIFKDNRQLGGSIFRKDFDRLFGEHPDDFSDIGEIGKYLINADTGEKWLEIKFEKERQEKAGEEVLESIEKQESMVLINHRDGKFNIVTEDLMKSQGDCLGAFEDSGGDFGKAGAMMCIVESTKPDDESLAWIFIAQIAEKPEHNFDKKELVTKILNANNIKFNFVYGGRGNPDSVFVPYLDGKIAGELISNAANEELFKRKHGGDTN